MEPSGLLTGFFERIRNDHRISTTHIGIFAAVLHYSVKSGGCNPVRAYSRDIMEIAKISALKTYCRCIKDLDSYGYIRYNPSKKKNVPSRILFIESSSVK